MTTTNAVASDSMVAATTAERAIDALLNCENPKIIPADDFIYLILTLKDLKEKERTKPYDLYLSNPIHTPSSSKICLIIDDRPSSKLNKRIAKKFIKDQGIPITKIIPVSELKTDYKSIESLRNLSDSYDFFLFDQRAMYIFTVKSFKAQFFRKIKCPAEVDLTQRNWGEQLEKACHAVILHTKRGRWTVKVGRLAMDKEVLVKNVAEVIEGLVDLIPGNWGGVRSLDLKFGDSVMLPLYRALPDPHVSLKIEGDEDEIEKIEDSNVGEKRKKGISVKMGVEEQGRNIVSKETKAKAKAKSSVKPAKRKKFNEESITTMITEVGKKLQLHDPV